MGYLLKRFVCHCPDYNFPCLSHNKNDPNRSGIEWLIALAVFFLAVRTTVNLHHSFLNTTESFQACHKERSNQQAEMIAVAVSVGTLCIQK